MYYFLNTKVDINKSGIEHAQIKRMNLFNQHQIQNKIVTKALVLNAVDILKASRIPLANYLNMYDFFRQETIKNSPYMLSDFKIPAGMTMRQVNDEYLIDYQGKTLMILMTVSSSDLRIDNIRLLSKDGKLVKTSWYDRRGFIGVEEYFDKTNHLSVKQILSPSGKAVCQIFYEVDKQNKVKPTLYQLLGYQGLDLEFSSEEDLMTFFLDELAKNDRQTVLIGDRATEYAYSLFHMTEKTFKVLVLHSSHVADNDHPLSANLNNNFYYSLNHLNNWDAIVTSTQAQRTDFTYRYGHNQSTYTIPVGTIEDNITIEPFENRVPYYIGLVARLAHEKQQLQAVKAIEKVLEVVPQVQLHLFGYSNGNYGQKVKDLVAQKNLAQHVIFEEYTDDIQKAYQNMQLQLLTSSVEGFAMAVLEGQSHGVPQVSYDIKYGPSDIITDNEDGYLVKPNDSNALADKIIDYFKNLDQAKQMSQKAYQNSQRFSQSEVFKTWQPLFNQVRRFYQRQEVIR
ncbi:glycosyltransferase [Holzapfeliella sp. He02]|uniref:Glycosyltransferase n=1 Tax=Holzapfeliella saturejae TaxID=3082953 RepID=A0ABU8SEH2_9LACO